MNKKKKHEKIIRFFASKTLNCSTLKKNPDIMKKILLSIVGLVCLSVIGYMAFDKQEISTNECKEVTDLNQQHRTFMENSPFSEVSKLSKKERKAIGLPPNKYLEREWELTMNPELGRPTSENLKAIKESMNNARLEAIASGRVSGDAIGNEWVERGPNNVGGRTRAVMFDPNDATNETVFAGGVSGGLWKNTNISNVSSVWTQVSISENLNVSSISVDPINSNIFYIGTGESYVGGDVNGNGVWKSTDGGTTWAQVLGGITGATTFEAASVITMNSPVGVAGDYPCFPTTAFGPTIASVMTADLVLANDGLAPNSDGCTALNSMTGKIALIRRGACTFVTKVKGAQDAGAIGVIVMNNVAGTPVAMGGTDATITIPSVMVSQEVGDILEAALGGGTVNGSLNPPTGDYTGNLVPGIQHVNDIVIRNNGGTSEIYVAAGAARYGAANATTYLGGDTYGLYKSVDAGANWAEIAMPLTSGGKKHTPNDLEIGADNKIWIGTTSTTTTGQGGGKVFASTNAAATTFEEKYSITNGNRMQIATSPTNAGTVYVLAQVQTINAAGDAYEAPFLGMVKTTNSFTSTTNMALPSDGDTGISADDFTRGQAFYDLVIAVDPTNDQNLFVGGIDLFKSTNAGTTWSQFSHWYGGFSQQEVHADQHAIAFGNGDVNKMVFGNDGGVYYSPNKGTSTSSRNSGYNTAQFHSIGVAPSATGDNFAGGLQDNGTQQFNNATAGMNGSSESQGGDGGATDYDQDTGNYYISNYVYNQNIVQRNLSGGGLKQINSESTSMGDFVNQQDLDSNLNLLYTNYSDAASGPQIMRYKIANGGGQKTILSNALLTSGGSPTALKVSPYTTTSTKLYVGTLFGDLLMATTADVGIFQTWSDIGTASFVGSISDVEFGATESEIFVTMHNYGVESIWYTSNGGTTWATKEGNLPDMPVKCILQNPLNSEEVVIGTELGVWYTNDFSSVSPTWLPAFNGMSNVKVTDLDVRDDNAIYASTYGRGVFSGVFTAAPLSVNDEEMASNTISLYPTVSNGNVFVKSTVNYPKTKVMVYDINGRLAHESSMNLYSNGEAGLNLSNLSSGMYFVNLSSEKLNRTIKIVKK